MNQIYSVLNNLGLSENEVKVYIEAIKHEQVSPFTIAKQVGIPRTTVYDVMFNLALKGLITIKQSQGLEKQQTWIVAKNPSTLRDMVFKRRKELASLEVDLVDVLPLLKKEYVKQAGNTNFQFFPGIEGAKQVQAQTGEGSANSTLYVYESLIPMDTLGRSLINKDVDVGLERKRKISLPIKSIISWNKWTRHVLAYQHERNEDYISLHNFRYIDNPHFDIHLDISLLEDTIRCVCAKEDEVWGLVIKSPLLSKTLRSIFDVLWIAAIPVTEKLVEAWGKNEFFEAEKRKSLHK